jgi:gas vesicle protein
MGLSTKFLAGLVIGAAVGGAIGTLLATDKGKEMVGQLKDVAEKAGERLKSAAKKFGKEVEGAMETGRQWANEMDERGKPYGTEV